MKAAMASSMNFINCPIKVGTYRVEDPDREVVVKCYIYFSDNQKGQNAVSPSPFVLGYINHDYFPGRSSKTVLKASFALILTLCRKLAYLARMQA